MPLWINQNNKNHTITSADAKDIWQTSTSIKTILNRIEIEETTEKTQYAKLNNTAKVMLGGNFNL